LRSQWVKSRVVASRTRGACCGVADVYDEVLLADLGDARVFDPPVLLEAVAQRMQTAHGIDLPAGASVVAGGGHEGGQAGAVLDPQQEQGAAIDDGGAGVEHRVDHLGKVVRA
jgi:hypothetical protein